ncbi:SDR family oxidoreductase [Streptomyces sp. Li-HN-5-11]|uniref:SDR family oxidoreductase n=1 Tax=Streptomyces sp. Li-HN-5-11 TaxID=3075432 RepID=UPI0028A8A96A|nr:SDR family oxidoreductase [Streptomyces sp. Li-HN-5-11]WNM31949.1 SDR family oxidoreductase [Streptomyces sp. Li-HN-5-11]
MTSQKYSVNGKVALITGAANGLGAAVARQMHAQGAKLVLIDIDEPKLDELATELGKDRVFTQVADVRDFTAMKAAADQGIELFGGIDIVVANAAIGSFGTLLQVDPEDFRTVVDVNLIGVFHTVRVALASVLERGGYLLLVSSLASYLPEAGMTSYTATKAAVEHLASCLRLELVHRGVGVGSMHMIGIDTPMMREGWDEHPALHAMIHSLPAPMRKLYPAEEVAAACVKGIEARKHRINSPSWVGLGRWLKPLLTTPLGEIPVRRLVAPLIIQLDKEVAELGRSLTPRYEKLRRH